MIYYKKVIGTYMVNGHITSEYRYFKDYNVSIDPRNLASGITIISEDEYLLNKIEQIMVYFKIKITISSGFGTSMDRSEYRYFKDDIDKLDRFRGEIILVSEDEYLLNTVK